MIKNGTRLYINLTNHCNTNCPFCCMYSGTNKNRFMSFEIFKEIINSCDDQFELQLEGGEPLLHNDLFLFIEYAIHTQRCKKIIILTNGILIEKYMKRLIDIANWNKIMIECKISINYWLLELDDNFLFKMNKLVFATKFIENINILFNVRKRKSDDWIDEELKKYQLYDKSNIFYFQSYGKLKDSNYEKPVIVQNIENWKVYASDGTCFGQDLIARSEYEPTS